MQRPLALGLLFLSACPPPGGEDGGMDGGPNLPPSVTSIAPDRGPLAGGTQVTINGSGFVDGCTVTFGTTAAASVVFESPRKLTALTAAAPAAGRASVTVANPDGKQGTLPAAFLFEGSMTGQITEAFVLNPATATDSSGASPVLWRVRAQVKVPGVTEVAGQGGGVRAQVGFAAEGSMTFTWVDAAFLSDADLFDDYAADVTLPAAMGAQSATYVLAARFSVTQGASWVEADRDGSSNGVQDAQRARVTVTRRSVEWCKLGGEMIAAPDVFDLRVGEAGPTLFGQVYAQGITDRADAGVGIVGELGVGDAGTDPSTWAWAQAAYNHDTGSGSNDEFQATLPTGAAFQGDKRFAFRFGINGGPWAYCDSDGLAMGGFTESQAGRLTLRPAGIDECRLQFPLTLMSREGVDAGLVYGRVYARTVTEAAGAGAGVEAQLGYGATGTLPTDAWAWSPATYNVEAPNGQEEWQATLVGPPMGAYAYAYRFRYQGGAWTYCDSDPSDGTVVSAQLGALTSIGAGTKLITACKLQFVDRASVASGDPVIAYGRVRVPGFSEASGVTPGLVGEVGVGTAGDNASTSSAWGWARASYNVETDAGEDELTAVFQPAYSGTRAVSFRFSVDDGGWTYCDLNGSDVNGYEVGQQWGLSVGNPSNIDYCKLQFPPAADAGTLVYGQLMVPGVTPPLGADPSIRAELGVGKKVEDPGVSSAWAWTQATYNAGCTSCGANNDEYQAALGAGAAGHYAYRFTRNDGGSYCYADLDGAGSATGAFNGDTGAGGENLGVVVP